MAIPFLSSIDLTQNQALRLVLHNATSDPSGVEGQIYYNTATNQAMAHNGSAFVNIGQSQEQVEDIAGDMFSGNEEDGITVTYQTADNTVDFVTDVQLDNSVTLTNKTLTTPTIVAAGWANANHTHDGSTTGGTIAIADTTGTLAVNRGGTGATSLTSNAILTGSGTSAIQAESTLTYDGTTLQMTNAVPHFIMTDTTNNTDARLSANSSAGSFFISADFNNEANTTKIHFFCDGDEVGQFRGNNAYVGSLRLFPEKNDSTDQGIFVGTDAAGTYDDTGDWSYKRILSYGANDTLHLYPGTATTGVIQITSGGDITTKADTITFGSANSTDPLVIIKNTNSDANGARLHFVKDKGAAGADGDDIGTIEFISDDAGQVQTSFAKIVAEVSESDNTDEAGKLSFYVAESDGTTTTLTAGLVLEGEHATNGEVDVTIGAGAESTTTIVGDLVVNGSHTTVDSTTIAIGDNMYKFAKDNAANSLDIGWYGKIVATGTKYPVAYYDASTGVSTPKWLFGITTTEPGNTADIETKGTIVANLEGAVDAGSGAITTTGLISGGSLDIDDVVVNGSTIGHTSDTDLMTVADGVLTVAGEVDATSLDVGTGGVDVNGTLEANGITIGGVSLQVVVEDHVGAMLDGTETGISVGYDSGNNNLDFVVDDTTVAGDSGSTGITPGDTLTIAGGSNVTTAMSSDTLTINASTNNSEVDARITAREFTVELDAAGQAAVTKSTNTYTVDHQLDSFNVLCQVIEDNSNSTDGSYQTVHVDVNRPTLDTVTVAFADSVTDGHYRILIQKIG